MLFSVRFKSHAVGLPFRNWESFLLDSVVQETCRLTSGVFVVRYVTEDTWFTTDKGESFLLRKGDRAAIYPPTIHKDPEIFDSPEVRRHLQLTDFFTNLQQPTTTAGTTITRSATPTSLLYHSFFQQAYCQYCSCDFGCYCGYFYCCYRCSQCSLLQLAYYDAITDLSYNS